MENDQQNKIPYHLIVDEMERELSPGEMEELEQWKAASSENLVIYNELKNAGQQLALLGLYQNVDTDDAWNRISPQVQQHQQTPQVRKAGKRIMMLSVFAAAAVIIVVSAILFYWFSSPRPTFYRTAKNERRQIALPDGSQVFLNENSTITYEKRSFDKRRHVKLLEGEAYFVVEHDDKNEFLVNLNDVVVRDIGTSFVCKMDAGKIEVIVNSGIVLMEYQPPVIAKQQLPHAKKVALFANQMATFDRDTRKISYLTTVPPNYMAWQDKKLRYVQIPLKVVFQDLNRVYGTQVIFKDTSLKERKLSAFFIQKTEDQIMHIIARSLQLKVVKKDSIFIVSQ